MKAFFCTIEIFIFCLHLNAQTQVLSKDEAKQIITKINQSMLNPKFYSANLDYSIYSSYSDSIPLEKINGFYKRNGAKEHSSIIGIETIQNEKERVVIDTGMENIILASPNLKPQLIESSMQAAVSMCKKITKTKTALGYVLSFNIDPSANLGFSNFQLEYLEEDYFISSITLFYQNANIPGYEKIQNPKVRINYSNINTSRIPNSEFEIDKYLLNKNKLYALTNAYQTYTFYNQLNNTTNQ